MDHTIILKFKADHTYRKTPLNLKEDPFNLPTQHKQLRKENP